MANDPQYQSIGSSTGSSNSMKKWEALGIKKLTDMSFLDLGCNEGFFVEKALEIGASKAVGVDLNGDLLEKAANRCPEGNFINMDWMDFLEQQENHSYDIIILLSALHYAKNYQILLSEIRRVLKHNGLFILEASIVKGQEAFYTPVTRGNPPFTDTVWHMTAGKFRELLLKDYVVRYIAKSAMQPGDPIPRHIYHAIPRRPVAIIISGESGAGKSELARLLGDSSSCPVYSIDQFVLHLIVNKHTQVSEVFADAYQPGRLDLVYDLLQKDSELRDKFISMFTRNIEDNKLFIVEGQPLMSNPFRENFLESLKKNYFKTVQIDLDRDYLELMKRFR